MDIIRNLLYEGVDPEALIARGAPPEHVMAVCREIVQGTRERDGFGEQETPDVDYSREGSMAYAIEPSEATAPSSENMVDDEMLAESPGSEATVEPLAYRVDPAQLLTSASVESPEPEAPRPPEPSFPTPVLSPPSHPIVSPVSQVPLESRPSPRLGSLLAPSLSVPDMPPTSASTSSGDQPAQSTLHTGLASLPPRPTSLLPPSGSTPQPSVPPVQLPVPSSPVNKQQSSKKKKKKKKGNQEEARANAAANASTEAGPGPSTMASQAISQANQTGPSQPPQPSQPHPHPPPPTKPLKMTKKEKKAARAQAAAAAAAAASTSASVSGPTGLPTGLPPRPAVYPEPYHAAPYIQDPYAMYPVQPQPQVQAHLQHQYQPQHQRQRQPDLPQVFQQPAIFDINVEVPVTPLAQDQPPPPQTAAPPLPPGSPPADLQTMLSESKRKVLESMRRRKEASAQPSASVTPALEAPALTSTRGSTTPAIQSAEVQSAGVSIRTGDLDRSVQEEAAALEREFLGMHMTAASMASHVDPNSVTQSRSMSMEMDVDVDMDIDEPEEGEILVVSPRVSAPAPTLTPAPASALPSILSTSATLPERPASAGSNLPVRRGIKRAHAEDLNESRTVSALAARPPLAARRLFCAPLRPHQLKISLDEDSDPDDTDDEDDEENRRIEADEKQRKLEEEIARLKAQIAMKKRRKLQSGQASGATTPIPTDMGSNADTEVEEISVSQDQGNLDIVKSAVIQSIGNPRGEDAFRCKSSNSKSNLCLFSFPVLSNSFRAYPLASTPADIKQLTQELAQKEAQKEAHDEVMQVHAPGAGVTASQDSGMF